MSCFTPYVRTVLFLWRVINIQAEIKRVIWRVIVFASTYFCIHLYPGEEGTCKKIGWGVRPASQNHQSIFYQSMRFSLPHFRPDQKFDALSLTIVADTVVLNITCEGLFLIVLSIIKKKWLLLKNVPNPRLDCKNHILQYDQNCQNGYPIYYEENGLEPLSFEVAHTYMRLELNYTSNNNRRNNSTLGSTDKPY